MGYIFGPNYIKANKRWLGIKKDMKLLIDKCSSIIGPDGHTYYWAPSYTTNIMGATAANDYLYGKTTPVATIPGYTDADNTIKFYEIAYQDCWPNCWLDINYHSPSEKMIMPGAVFETLDGTTFTLNTSNEPKLASECESIRLIIPKIRVYGITCTKNGGYSKYSNPLRAASSTSNRILGRQAFIDEWNTRVNMQLPISLSCLVEAQSTNAPITNSPTGFQYRGTETGNLQTLNYMNYNNGFYDSGSFSASEGIIIRQSNCHIFTTQPTNYNYIEKVQAGQLLENTSAPEYNQRNASHFQCAYRRWDTDDSNGERFWGYLGVIDTVELRLAKLHN